MRAKEYLSQIKAIEIELYVLSSEINDRYYSVQGVKYDGISGNRDLDATLHNTEKIIELQKKYEARQRELYDIRDGIIQTILKIEDERARQVIYLRYCRHYSFHKIAKEMNYGERNIFNLHKKGLMLVDDIISVNFS